MYMRCCDSYQDSVVEVEGPVLIIHSEQHPEDPSWGYMLSLPWSII